MAYWSPVVIILLISQVLGQLQIIKSPPVVSSEITRWLPGIHLVPKELIGVFNLVQGQCSAEYNSKVIHCAPGKEVAAVKIIVSDAAKATINLKKIHTGFKDSPFLWVATIGRHTKVCSDIEDPAEVEIYVACKIMHRNEINLD